MNTRILAVAILVFVLRVPDVLCAGDVHVVVSPTASDLERLAASELADQYRRLFDSRVTRSATPPDDAQFLVLVGDAQSNPAIKEVIGGQWPKLSDEGIFLKGMKRGAQHYVIVGGGSPRATLWAAYELGHRNGIRYVLRGDIDPPQRPYTAETFEVVMEPEFRTRSWRTINDFAIGPESWGLADHKQTLRQLAKMKFNQVLLSLYPWQPFVHYEFRGVKKQTATLWYGERLRVDGDTPGKKVFAGKRFFENPEFAGKKNYDQMTAAGISLIRGIIAEAHRLGMTVGLSISPLEFPREFAKVLPGAKQQTGLKNLTIGPGLQQHPTDPLLLQLVATKIRAYLATYPTLDSLCVSMPEFPEWTEHADSAWQQLNAARTLGRTSLNELMQTASQRKLISSGERGIQSVKGNVTTLAFFKVLFQNRSLLKRKDGGQVELVIRQVDPALFPILDRVIPAGAATLNFVDYTARRVAENLQLLSLAPASRVKCRLIFTLADDNVGLLSQVATRSLGKLAAKIQALGWDGFSTRYWIPAELDSSAHFLSRVSFDRTVTPRSAHDDLFLAITDNPSATDRLWMGSEHLEAATGLIDKHNIGFAFPVSGLMMKHYRPDPLPEWWKQVAEHYNQSMVELYRANGAVALRARDLLFYYAKRGEFNVYYMATVEAVRNAAIAKSKGETEKAIEHLEAAVESLYNTITTISDVARGPSDRGLIAVLAEHAYRPLVAEYERMLEEAE